MMAKGRHFRQCLLAFCAILLVCCGFAVDARADLSGARTLTSGYGLTGNGDWASGASLWYQATKQADGWLYEYKLTVADKGISHFIFETSDGFGFDQLISGFIAVATDVGVSGMELANLLTGPKSFTEDNGNPGIPGSVWGIKFDVPYLKKDEAPKPGYLADDTYEISFSFTSSHQPMWGNFYAKDGTTEDDTGAKIWNYLYNEGFALYSAEFLEQNRYAEYGDQFYAQMLKSYVLVPDTVTVPVPGAMLLGSLGLGAAGLHLKRKKARS